jgi:hypothetical protein
VVEGQTPNSGCRVSPDETLLAGVEAGDSRNLVLSLIRFNLSLGLVGNGRVLRAAKGYNRIIPGRLSSAYGYLGCEGLLQVSGQTCRDAKI